MVHEVMAEVLNISPIIVWVVALTQMLTFGLTLWGLLTSASRANAKRLDDHSMRLEEHAARISGLEVRQQAMPTTAMMHELEIAMERLNGKLATMSQAMAGHAAIMKRLEGVVGRHEDHFLDGARKNG